MIICLFSVLEWDWFTSLIGFDVRHDVDPETAVAGSFPWTNCKINLISEAKEFSNDCTLRDNWSSLWFKPSNWFLLITKISELSGKVLECNAEVSPLPAPSNPWTIVTKFCSIWLIYPSGWFVDASCVLRSVGALAWCRSAVVAAGSCCLVSWAEVVWWCDWAVEVCGAVLVGWVSWLVVGGLGLFVKYPAEPTGTEWLVGGGWLGGWSWYAPIDDWRRIVRILCVVGGVVCAK